MNVKPLADRVIILPAPAEEKTIGGIIIPDTAKEKPLRGEVIATGNGTKDEEMVLKKGGIGNECPEVALRTDRGGKSRARCRHDSSGAPHHPPDNGIHNQKAGIQQGKIR